MPGPRTLLNSKRVQIGIIGLFAAGLAIVGFEAGRKTVDAAAVADSDAKITLPATDLISQKTALLERDHSQITVREIATVPFSQLYDVLKSASPEQLLGWATDLERMPRGPRQTAAVTAYYKGLIQVDHRTAIKAVLAAQNLSTRDLALDAITKAAPESIWGDVAEMIVELPYPNSGSAHADIISNWSAVDPVAASEFIAAHPIHDDDDGDPRLASLLGNWGQIDPLAARDWLEADPSRQTKSAFEFLVSAWAATNRSEAIHYVLANVARPNFAAAVNGLAYEFVRKEKDQATSLILLLPPENAKAAVQYVAHETAGVIIGLPAGYQRPPEEVARWMITLPIDLWKDAIGEVAQRWVRDDATSATRWLDQLPLDLRDVALVSFCRTADRDDAAQRVLTLGQSISDRTVRDSALGQFARNLAHARANAIDAVNELPISDEQKAYLLRVMPEDKDGVH